MQDKLPDFLMNVALAILAPLITAAVAALTFVVRDWRLRRDANGRKTRAIEQAAKQVTFIDAWLSTYGKSPRAGRQAGPPGGA